ncbi:MAG: aminopeptidase [Sumerlaeia bacterium]
MIGPIDPRDFKLAEMLLNHSVAAKENDLVYIECVGSSTMRLGAALVEVAANIGVAPALHYTDSTIQRRLINAGNEKALKRLGEFELEEMKNAQCYIGIRGAENIFETSGVHSDKMALFTKHIRIPVHLKQRVNHTRWAVLRYPNASMAQLAQMSTQDFEDFYYNVCLVDYPAMGRAVQPLVELMDKTDRVKIVGPGETNLSFSIKYIPSIPCYGEHNIPDGECFTAPLKESINGVVQFNTPTVYEGEAFDCIRIEFENGKAVKAHATGESQTEKLNRILDRDAGARFIGEFAIAFNPGILTPMRDILFDEKIAGSFHMAFGQSYDKASNGNDSAIHWDCVCIQRPEYGGGEIYFDDLLIRKNGEFVVDALKGLNPSSMK